MFCHILRESWRNVTCNKCSWQVSNQGCHGYMLYLLYKTLGVIARQHHLHLRHHHQWMSYFGVKLHFYCKRHTQTRSCFFLWESTGTGIITLAQVWVPSFQESLRLAMTQIPSFENFGLDYEHKECKTVSFSLCFSILCDRTACGQSTQCFPLNKPHVSSQKIQCVISEREARGTGKTWKG